MRRAYVWSIVGLVVRLAVHNLKCRYGGDQLTLISTPSNSWTRMKEGHYLWSHGIDPYDGDLVHGSPVALHFSSWLMNSVGSEDRIAIVFCAADVLVAVLLFFAAAKILSNMLMEEEANIATYCVEARETMLLKQRDTTSVPHNVFVAYLFCPYAILNAADMTMTVFSNLLLACLLLSVAHGHYMCSAIFLALAAYEDFYPLALVAPVAFIAWKGLYAPVKPEQKSRLMSFVALFIVSLVLAMYISATLMGGSWSFLRAKYGFLWNVPDLTPNIGLFWYFFTEMFEHFRIFFICSFQINAFIYAAPLLIKFHEEPMRVIYSLLALGAIFKSYPCVGDVGFYLALLPIWAHLAPCMRQQLVTFCFFVATMVLAPVLWHLWLYDGSANANFFFGITLGFAAAQILLLTDVLFAFMRRDFELHYGRKKDDKPFVLALQ